MFYPYNLQTLTSLVNLQQDWADHDRQLIVILHSDSDVEEVLSWAQFIAEYEGGRVNEHWGRTWARLTFCEDEGWADLAAFYADFDVDPATIGE